MSSSAHAANATTSGTARAVGGSTEDPRLGSLTGREQLVRDVGCAVDVDPVHRGDQRIDDLLHRVPVRVREEAAPAERAAEDR
ncbi:hypothetical protein ABZ354_27745 [Streptomyces sp. NPDC005925]|uniref:hypothetical protein n=1 Tax=Streptomyces sp. NPDC005925 TaxID=3157172 RepID=UPI0033D1484F